MGFVYEFAKEILILLAFCVAGGTAIFLGITMRKNANAKAEKEQTSENAGDQVE